MEVSPLSYVPRVYPSGTGVPPGVPTAHKWHCALPASVAQLFKTSFLLAISRRSQAKESFRLEGERPDPDEEHWNREYPDPEELEDLADLPDTEGSSASGGFPVPGLLKVITVLMSLAFVGSLLLPILEPLISKGDRIETTPNATAQETREYEQWISRQVNTAMAESPAAGRARFLGVQFDGSPQHPVIGILVEGVGPQSFFPTAALQSPSIAVLQRLFADERSQSVTLTWVRPALVSENDQPSPDIILILVVGMLRQTAQGLDWTDLDAEDLRNVADLYEEVLPLQGVPTLPSPLTRSPAKA